ncbi:MAG: hypothetical protein AAB491_01970 [Patescibacteria group bacterium]
MMKTLSNLLNDVTIRFECPSNENLAISFINHRPIKLTNNELEMEGIAEISQMNISSKKGVSGFFIKGIITFIDILAVRIFIGFYDPSTNKCELHLKSHRSSRAG